MIVSSYVQYISQATQETLQKYPEMYSMFLLFFSTKQ